MAQKSGPGGHGQYANLQFGSVPPEIQMVDLLVVWEVRRENVASKIGENGWRLQQKRDNNGVWFGAPRACGPLNHRYGHHLLSETHCSWRLILKYSSPYTPQRVCIGFPDVQATNA